MYGLDQFHDLKGVAERGSGRAVREFGSKQGVSNGVESRASRQGKIVITQFGIDLASVRGEHSVYRDAKRLQQLYGYLPPGTLNPQADYFDQTDIFRLQQSAADAGKRRIILFIFDGLDWPTMRAAAIYRAGEVRYSEGRGSGLHYQDYRGAATDFGCMVTSPYCDSGRVAFNLDIAGAPSI
jgi:alkaline phosphatase